MLTWTLHGVITIITDEKIPQKLDRRYCVFDLQKGQFVGRYQAGFMGAYAKRTNFAKSLRETIASINDIFLPFSVSSENIISCKLLELFLHVMLAKDMRGSTNIELLCFLNTGHLSSEDCQNLFGKKFWQEGMLVVSSFFRAINSSTQFGFLRKASFAHRVVVDKMEFKNTTGGRTVSFHCFRGFKLPE